MKNTKVVCDKCKKENEALNNINKWIILEIHYPTGGERKDYCDECSIKVFKFFYEFDNEK